MEVRLQQITKRFGDVLANDGISLEIRPGEVLALLGENGAGKSTLMRTLYGLFQPDAGHIQVDGETVRFVSPAEARARGIGMVFQEFNLIPAMTVKDNLLLALDQTGWRLSGKSTTRAMRSLGELAPSVRADTRVADLAVGERQLLELAKVLNAEASFIILDEPTSVLTPVEVERLYARIRALVADGRSVILISHKLDDVFACATRVAVLRRGRLVYEASVSASSRSDLVRHFIGSEAREETKPKMPPCARAEQLELVNVSVEKGHTKLVNVTFSVAKGEVFGVAGVSGNGQQLLTDLICGFEEPSAGRIRFARRDFNRCKPTLGKIGYIPEYPIVNAVAGALNLRTNLAVKELGALPWFRPLRRWDRSADLDRFNVLPPDPEVRARNLSGGNLQKLVLARELGIQRELVVACYPTMGLDLNASREVRANLIRQAKNGAVVVWFSEDLDELLQHCDRLAALCGGRIAGVVTADEAERDRIGAWMAGGV